MPATLAIAMLAERAAMMNDAVAPAEKERDPGPKWEKNGDGSSSLSFGSVEQLFAALPAEYKGASPCPERSGAAAKSKDLAGA